MMRVLRTETSPVLDEADGGGFFTETLTAEIKTVFSNKAGLMGTETTLAAALAKLSWTGKPDGVVGHGICFLLLFSFLLTDYTKRF